MASDSAASDASLAQTFDLFDSLAVERARQRRRVSEQEAAVEQLDQLLAERRRESAQLAAEQERAEAQLSMLERRKPALQAACSGHRQTLLKLTQMRDMQASRLEQERLKTAEMVATVVGELEKARERWVQYEKIYLTMPVYLRRTELTQLRKEEAELVKRRDALQQERSALVSDREFCVQLAELWRRCRLLEGAISERSVQPASQAGSTGAESVQSSAQSTGFTPEKSNSQAVDGSSMDVGEAVGPAQCSSDEQLPAEPADHVDAIQHVDQPEPNVSQHGLCKQPSRRDDAPREQVSAGSTEILNADDMARQHSETAASFHQEARMPLNEEQTSQPNSVQPQQEPGLAHSAAFNPAPASFAAGVHCPPAACNNVGQVAVSVASIQMASSQHSSFLIQARTVRRAGAYRPPPPPPVPVAAAQQPPHPLPQRPQLASTAAAAGKSADRMTLPTRPAVNAPHSPHRPALAVQNDLAKQTAEKSALRPVAGRQLSTSAHAKHHPSAVEDANKSEHAQPPGPPDQASFTISPATPRTGSLLCGRDGLPAASYWMPLEEDSPYRHSFVQRLRQSPVSSRRQAQPARPPPPPAADADCVQSPFLMTLAPVHRHGAAEPAMPAAHAPPPAAKAAAPAQAAPPAAQAAPPASKAAPMSGGDAPARPPPPPAAGVGIFGVDEPEATEPEERGGSGGASASPFALFGGALDAKQTDDGGQPPASGMSMFGAGDASADAEQTSADDFSFSFLGGGAAAPKPSSQASSGVFSFF